MFTPEELSEEWEATALQKRNNATEQDEPGSNFL
jgi:hypothetical protein